MKTPSETTRLPPTTLSYLLQDDIIPFETLYERHGSASTIAQVLLGIKPNTGKYLEIWQPANRMYYFMVPSFLNLPAVMFGFGAPKNLMSLALYASSLAAGCPYCTSHTCTFAVRRGVAIDKLGVETIEGRHGAVSDKFTPVEKSVIDVSEALAVFPCKLTNEQRNNLRTLAKDAETTEAIILGTAMMGYLNKSMDALGMPLEIDTYRETRDILGSKWSPGLSGQLVDPAVHTAEAAPPTDGISTYWSMLTQGRSAGRFEANALAGTSEKADEASEFLFKKYGYDFPVLKQMVHARAMRAIATMMHECFNPETSVIGVKAKLAVGQVFATATQSKPIQDAITAIAKHFEIDRQTLDNAVALAKESDPIAAVQQLYPAEEDRTFRALLVEAHAISWSPARVNEQVVAFCGDAKVESVAIVEVVGIISGLQMLHRIASFYLDDEN